MSTTKLINQAKKQLKINLSLLESLKTDRIPDLERIMDEALTLKDFAKINKTGTELDETYSYIRQINKENDSLTWIIQFKGKTKMALSNL